MKTKKRKTLSSLHQDDVLLTRVINFGGGEVYQYHTVKDFISALGQSVTTKTRAQAIKEYLQYLYNS